MLVAGLLFGALALIGSVFAWALAKAAGRETPSPLAAEQEDRRAA